MSIGNLKDTGNQGNNFPWQLKMLLGQQCACDELQAINANTDNVEFLLSSILTTLQASTEYEAKFVIDTCDSDKVYLEVRIWNPDTSTWGPISYYTPGSSTPVTPVGASTPGCLQYTDPSGILAQILSVLQDIELGIPEALGQTTMTGSMPVVIASDQTAIPVTDNGGSLTVDAIALDIRPLTCADTVSLCFNDGVSDVTVSSTNPLPVNAVVTVPTPLPVSQDPTSNPWTVDATDLDIRDLTFATDSVDVTGSDVTVSNTVDVTATDLDIRDLTFATDSVDVSGSNVNAVVTATALDIRPLDCSTDSVAICGTVDVNIVSGVTLEVNLDPDNDAVTIYGSNPTVPISTDGAGHLQVDILTLPEVEIKNDAGNPIPVTGTVTITDGSGPVTVDGTVTANQGTNPWVVGQATHDNLNANANIQVNNTDVSAANPVPVVQQYPAVYASSEVVTQTGTTPVVFSAGATSMSVQNLGNDNITLDTDASTGVILPPGVSITWDAPTGQRLDTFTFTGTSVSSLFIVTAVIAS